MKAAKLALVGILISGMVWVAPALAHHGFAQFAENATPLEGSVKEFQWTNPHCWIQLNVTGPDGKVTEWSLELGSPGISGRSGWTRKTLSPGDKVSVTIHAKKDGSPTGQLVEITLPDGRHLTQGGLNGGGGGPGAGGGDSGRGEGSSH